MSTRAHIILKFDDEVVERFYYHSDGYPSGVGVDLVEYLDEFSKSKFYNNSLGGATSFAGWLTDNNPSYERGESFHGDEEYIYVIQFDKNEVHCFDCWKTGEFAHNNTELEVEIPKNN